MEKYPKLRTSLTNSAEDQQPVENEVAKADNLENQDLNKKIMNRFINNTIQKVSVVNGERKKSFLAG